MKFRRIIEDYEARLIPAGAPEAQKGRGKVEWEHFGDGDRELELSVRGLEIVGKASLEVRLNGALIGQCEIEKGRGRFVLRMSEGRVPPTVQVSDRLTIVREGRELLYGIFAAD